MNQYLKKLMLPWLVTIPTSFTYSTLYNDRLSIDFNEKVDSVNKEFLFYGVFYPLMVPWVINGFDTMKKRKKNIQNERLRNNLVHLIKAVPDDHLEPISKYLQHKHDLK